MFPTEALTSVGITLELSCGAAGAGLWPAYAGRPPCQLQLIVAARRACQGLVNGPAGRY